MQDRRPMYVCYVDSGVLVRQTEKAYVGRLGIRRRLSAGKRTRFQNFDSNDGTLLKVGVMHAGLLASSLSLL